MRSAEISRKTNETDIVLKLNLDGTGAYDIHSGVGFLDHMLTLFSRHSGIDLTVHCEGDTWVDFHHTTEDIGIALGDAVKEALGDKRGITRYASLALPMDETLILAAVDISGRGAYYGDLDIPTQKVGDFDTELIEDFMDAFASHSGITLHLKQLAGRNSHHILEGCFKALAHVMKTAAAIDPNEGGRIPSTKGLL